MEQGLYVMAIGMGTVFSFLGLMVLVMKGAAVVFRNFPDDAVRATANVPSLPASDKDAESRRLAIAVAAATAWRRGHRPTNAKDTANKGSR